MSLRDIYGKKRKELLNPEIQEIPSPSPTPKQPSAASQVGQMALGIGMNKGVEKGIEYATPYAEKAATAGKDFFMSQFAPSAAASTAPAVTVGGAPLTGALASSAAPASTAAASGGMMAGMTAAAPWVAGGLLADELLGLGIRKNVLGFSEGGKVYAYEGEKVKMTPEQRAAFYNLQISNGQMTPEIAHGALMNEYGMRPGIAQSLIQSQYNVRQTPTGPTSLFSNTPQVTNLPQSREVPMMNAPVNPYDEFTQVPRDLQNPTAQQPIETQGPYIQARPQYPMAKAPTVENTAAMEDVNIGTNAESGSGFNMGSFLGPLALAALYAARNR